MRLFARGVRLFYLVTYPISSIFLHKTHRVRVLIISDNHILLQRSSFGHQKWSLPGGGVAKKEDIHQASVREVMEEVGVSLQPNRIVHLGDKDIASNGDWPMLHLSFCYARLAKPLKPQITRPYEILEAKWFPVSGLPNRRSKTVDIAMQLLAHQGKK